MGDETRPQNPVAPDTGGNEGQDTPNTPSE